MYVVAALQCRNGKHYAQALDKLKEGISGEGYFSNSVCSVAVSILCVSGDLSDAYLLLQYLVLYCQEEISAIFFRRYAQLIMSVEELAKTDIEDLVVSYMQNSSKKSFLSKHICADYKCPDWGRNFQERCGVFEERCSGGI